MANPFDQDRSFAWTRLCFSVPKAKLKPSRMPLVLSNPFSCRNSWIQFAKKPFSRSVVLHRKHRLLTKELRGVRVHYFLRYFEKFWDTRKGSFPVKCNHR